MTIPIEHLPDDVGRRQARELLGVASDADLDVCRRAALAHVDQVEYDATDKWHDSVEILFGLDGAWTSATGASHLALHEEAESSLSDQIEVFAARFFAIETGNRMQIWNEFRKRARFSVVLSRRLALLEPGLNLVVPNADSLGQDQKSQLVRWILAMFPLRPAARCAFLVQAGDAMRNSPFEWEQGAVGLEYVHPEIGQLVPDVVGVARGIAALARQLDRETASRRRAARWRKWVRWRSAMWSILPLSIFGVINAAYVLALAVAMIRSHLQEHQPIESLQSPHNLPGLFLLCYDATGNLPEPEGTDLRKRMKYNCRLSDSQMTYLQRYFRARRRYDLMHSLQVFQEMARPAEPAAEKQVNETSAGATLREFNGTPSPSEILRPEEVLEASAR